MKRILFATLAGVVIFACQNPGDVVSGKDYTKSVSIKIKKGTTTRAALGYEVPAGAITELTGGTLFFFNAAGTTVLTYTLKDEDFEEDSASILVEGVPTSATSVAMIANPADDLSNDTPVDFDEFLEATFGIANQASMSDEAGENDNDQPVAVQGIALLDELDEGAANELTAYAGTDKVAYTHSATINLVPAVSRIEIGTLGENGKTAVIVKESNTTGLVSFDFEGIYINNYSTSFTLGFDQAETLFGSDIQPNTADTDWATAYAALEPCNDLFDANEGNVTTSEGVGKFAYHIFPGEGVPHIIIKGSNFVYDDGRTVSTPKYWLIDSYKVEDEDGAEVEWAPGYVYKISNVQVGSTYPTDDPYHERVSVQVTVTVRAWQIQPVYVTPK